jgi:ABC-2 type transport system ATP-binding protein
VRSADVPWRFEAKDVTKAFDEIRANDHISLHVDPGEVYGLLGPNGAGKSTLVKQVIGLLKPVGGRITLGPYDLVEDPVAARQLCSYLPQAQMPIDSFKVREAIELTGRIRGGDHATVTRNTSELIEALDIGEWADVMGVRLSGGVRRLVGFAMVTVWPGRLVILDEPTNDVDPLRRRLLWDQIRRIAEAGSAVLLVTHNVMEAEKSVDRLAIIDKGKLVDSGTPASLKAADRGHLRLQVMLVPGAETPQTPTWVSNSVRVGNNLVSTIDSDSAAHSIGWAQELIGLDVAEDYALGSASLEDVYIRLTGDAEAGGRGDP